MYTVNEDCIYERVEHKHIDAINGAVKIRSFRIDKSDLTPDLAPRLPTSIETTCQRVSSEMTNVAA